MAPYDRSFLNRGRRQARRGRFQTQGGGPQPGGMPGTPGEMPQPGAGPGPGGWKLGTDWHQRQAWGPDWRQQALGGPSKDARGLPGVPGSQVPPTPVPNPGLVGADAPMPPQRQMPKPGAPPNIGGGAGGGRRRSIGGGGQREFMGGGGQGPRPGPGGAGGGGKPHMQFGQKGKGGGKKKGKRDFDRPHNLPPGTPPEIGGFPEMGEAGPNFLPNTPGWERARSQASDALYGAETDYNIASSLVDPQMKLQTARLDTDRAYAARDVDERLAERGLITSGIRAQDQQRKVAIPYGRQYQDLGLGAAGQYANLANQWGGANMDYQGALNEGLMQRFGDVMEYGPLGGSRGTYQAPQMPQFRPRYQPVGKPRKGGGKKKKGGRR